jgi:hypothetical protein
MEFPSKLSYAAVLKYSPRGTSHLSKVSRVIRDAIKNDGNIPFIKMEKRVEVRGIEWAVSFIPSELDKFPFLKNYLGPEIGLVPLPRSAPLTKGALWPTQRICEELVKIGLGAEVVPFLKRTILVQKSSTAEPGMRPGPSDHYSSTVIDNEVPSLGDRALTIVDDYITRGSSMVGMFRRLKEAFPNRQIRCFSLSTNEGDEEVDKLAAPCEGIIHYYIKSGKLHRDRGTPLQGSLF